MSVISHRIFRTDKLQDRPWILEVRSVDDWVISTHKSLSDALRAWEALNELD